MGIWVFLFVSNLLMPLLMIGFGRVFQKHPPKQINSMYGYRTKRSAKNLDTWYFAHLYFGKLWFRSGLAILPLTAAGMLPLIGKDADTIASFSVVIECIQLIPMLFPIFLTERELRRRFDQNGNRKL